MTEQEKQYAVLINGHYHSGDLGVTLFYILEQMAQKKQQQDEYSEKQDANK